MESSKKLFEEAKKVFPGGVNSPARAMKPYPFYVKYAKGSKLYTVDGEELIDYSLGFGPLILGHRDDYVYRKVVEQLDRGWLYGTTYELEIRLAEKIRRYFPSIEMMRFVNSGTEAVMNVIRVARGVTGKKMFIMFEGCYHGTYDAVLVKAGSSALTFSISKSRGVLDDVTKYTILAQYNDLDSVENAIKMFREDVAAIIVEPVAVNMGLVKPSKDFIKGLRELADKYSILLIFDEVVTGFRLAMGGAQQYFGVDADLTTLGKVVGGGFPIGVFGGRREYMEKVAPSGDIHNAGTFNAHPVSVAAGLATIERLEETNGIEKTSKYVEKLTSSLNELVNKYRLNIYISAISSMFQLFIDVDKVVNYRDVKKADSSKYLEIHRAMLGKGIYLAPSQYETNFVSIAHDESDLDKTVKAFEDIFRELSRV